MRCCPPHRDARGRWMDGYGRWPFLSAPLAAANTRPPQSILRAPSTPKAEQKGIATLGCASLGRLRCSVPARHDRLLACPGYCTAALRGQTHYGMDIPVPTVGISRSGPEGVSKQQQKNRNSIPSQRQAGTVGEQVRCFPATPSFIPHPPSPQPRARSASTIPLWLDLRAHCGRDGRDAGTNNHHHPYLPYHSIVSVTFHNEADPATSNTVGSTLFHGRPPPPPPLLLVLLVHVSKHSPLSSPWARLRLTTGCTAS